MTSMRIRSYFFAAFFFALPCSLNAQTPSAAPDVATPAALNALPEPADDLSPLKIINSQNVLSYKDLLPVELQGLFRDGQLEMEAASRIKIQPEYGQVWAKASAATKQNLLNGTLLRAGAKFGDGFLFGDAKELESEADPKALAQKIFWNIYSVWAAERVFGAQFEFHWFKEGVKPYRTLRGEFQRIFPAALADSKQSAQLFRELIRLTSPAFLTDLSWLTFRFIGADEDMLWVFSPAVKKLRQLTATNRSDPILRSSVSPEDFLVWGGKPEIVDARAEKGITALVPFLRSEAPALSTENLCLTFDRAAAVANRLAVRWNFESSRYLHGAGWVPSTSVFVPRVLWRIEFSSHDPFSVYGRQVLYVDQELMLPYYKFVYNRAGQLWKTVIGSYGFAGAAGADARSAYPAYTIVLDHLKNETYVIDFSRISVCTEPTPPLTLADFDPKRFAEVAKSSATPVPTPGPQVPTEETDER